MLKQTAEIEQLMSENQYLGGVVAIPFDHETVMALAHHFCKAEQFFLLESAATGPGQVARYSFMGFDPLITYQFSGEESVCHGLNLSLKNDPFADLQAVITAVKTDIINWRDKRNIELDDIRAVAGMVGFHSYDAARYVEPTIGEPPPRLLGVPDAFYMFTRNLLVFDHFFRSLYLVYFTPTNGREALTIAREVELGLQSLLQQVASLSPIKPIKIREQDIDFDSAHSQVDKETFLKRVDTCLEHIRQGDIFQVQIGNRLSVETDAEPFDIFRHLRILNPSPYMFYYSFAGHHIIGASPEMMVNVSGRECVHRPIAGTRKRSWDQKRDEMICKELQNDPKERAEHIMLVDLSRNDIGRISVPGTVRVDELMIVEKYSHVFHMVSQVSGELLEDCDAVNALKFSFPNGTVSGAPKIKAMQIIYALEDISREFYAGSLGLFSFSGNLKSTIMIRTIHYKDGVAATQASAGIVYDSIPENEWQETRNKMAACLTAMQNTI